MLDKRNTVVQELCGKRLTPLMGLPTQRDVDVAWRAFWKRRGHIPPPGVSDVTVGAFELPTIKFHEQMAQADED